MWGSPVAAKLAEAGLDMTGIDTVPQEVVRINAGQLTIEGQEPGLSEIVKQAVRDAKLRNSTRNDVVQRRALSTARSARDATCRETLDHRPVLSKGFGVRTAHMYSLICQERLYRIRLEVVSLCDLGLI